MDKSEPLEPLIDSNLEKHFNPQSIESYWSRMWEQKGCFRAARNMDAKSFAIQLPPPNVTGTLHMGHAFNQTIMDALTRYHKMCGYQTAWIPGMDHAGIATQIVVERKLTEEQTSRDAIGRSAFIERVWKWKEESGGKIAEQMRRLGVSTDWSLEYFTMDQTRSNVVCWAFIEWYRQGLIYRGKRLVNWDPQLLTAVSDLEVVHKEESGFLWNIRYPLLDGSAFLTIATTRPETLFGDSALVIHPDDSRYSHLVGAKVLVPLSGFDSSLESIAFDRNFSTDSLEECVEKSIELGWRSIPIIADDSVDPAFGSGVVKVTPAHDFNDYGVGVRNDLPFLSVFDSQAKLNANVPARYRGLNRLDARTRVVEDLQTLGLLESVQKHVHQVPRSDRTGAIIEPLLTDQWFVAMNEPTSKEGFLKGKSLAEKALEVYEEGLIQFIPHHWGNTYRQWISNIQDWCISRQLWWGHQIPAWYKADQEGKSITDGAVFVARNYNEAKEQAVQSGWSGPLVQDPDVLDTWFSSGLIPFSSLVFPETEDCSSPIIDPELSCYFPSSVLVTGFDILFFWVARMIMMTLSFTGKVPFHTVYVHALVRDAYGQKMSKSKGNTLDPVDLIDGTSLSELLKKRTKDLLNSAQADDIVRKTREEYPDGIKALGTDALRLTFLALATPGRDINFDRSRCQGYRNFCNKLWNATRFVLMNCSDFVYNSENNSKKELSLSPSNQWILNKLSQCIENIENHFSSYRFDWVVQCLYELIWDEYCDWYLEIAKINLKSSTERYATQHTLLNVLEFVLRLAHPVIPFVTEALWQKVAPLIGRYLPSGKTVRNDTIISESSPDFCIVDQSYPMSSDLDLKKAVSAADLDWINQLKALVGSCRNLRGALGISPAERPRLIVSGSSDLLSPYVPYLLSLGKLGTVVTSSIVPDLKKSSPSENNVLSVQTVGPFTLMLDVCVDVHKEKKRIEKELDKCTKDSSKILAKLSDEKFIARAPEDLVQDYRRKILQIQTISDDLISQLQVLHASIDK